MFGSGRSAEGEPIGLVGQQSRKTQNHKVPGLVPVGDFYQMMFVSLFVFLIPADAGWVDEGEAGYYMHSMVWLSRLRFQLIPGNAAGHKGTAEPNHDAANLRLWRRGWS